MNVREVDNEHDLIAWEIGDAKVVGESHCLKRKVVAVIAQEDGEWVGVGWNGPRSDEYPKDGVCPRIGMASGERYDLCDEACPGQRHAEIDALEDLDTMREVIPTCGESLSMYIYGHEVPCEECLAAVERAGIGEVVVIVPSPFRHGEQE